MKCVIRNFHMWNYAQDAYALCRVFKKSAPGPKIIEHYGAPYELHPQWTANDHSATELSSDGRGDDFGSSSYPFQSESCSSAIIERAPYSNAAAAVDGKWMQYLAEEAFNATNNPPFYDPSSFSYVPSKVKF